MQSNSYAPLLGMTTREEQNYLVQYTHKQYTGQGAIVDLGCWLGATTISLAAGLERNPTATDRRVHAFDTFQWHNWMDDYAGEFAGKLDQGNSFLEEFQRRTASHTNRIVIHQGDLTRMKWETGSIEFLLVDAMKSWPLAVAINQTFLSRMIPGSGLIMHQDFKFWGCPWIHLVMYRLKDYFDLEIDLVSSPGTVFRLVSPISADRVEDDLTIADFSLSEIDAAYEHWSSCLHGPYVIFLDFARVYALCEFGAVDTALTYLKKNVLNGCYLTPKFLKTVGRYFSEADVDALSIPWENNVDEVIAQQRPLWLWGAGSAGRSILAEKDALRLHAKGILDCDPAKQGEVIAGLQVQNPECLSHGVDQKPYIVITTQFFNEVIQQLDDWGYSAMTDFCVAVSF